MLLFSVVSLVSLLFVCEEKMINLYPSFKMTCHELREKTLDVRAVTTLCTESIATCDFLR